MNATSLTISKEEPSETKKGTWGGVGEGIY
jgi:hypothetical protein